MELYDPPAWWERWLYAVFNLVNLVVATQSRVNKDAAHIHYQARTESLIAGREIERIAILRYTKDHLSPTKWQEFADYYDFDELDKKYPENDLCQKLK